MRYLRPVDFTVFPADQFHSHFMANWDTGVESCMAILTRAPPGTATGAGGVTLGSHTHDVDQFYFVLSGRMTVQLGDDVHRADPGSLVQIPAGLPHWNWNEGDEDEVHLEILAPSAMTYDFARAFRPGDQMSETVAPGAVRKVDFAQRAGDQALVRPMAGLSTGSQHMAISLVDLPPPKGEGQGEGLSLSPVDQFYYVLDGKLGVQVGLENYEAGPHTLVVLPAGVVHRSWNAGAAPERHVLLQACASPEAGTPVRLG